jgi:hypothetical protein
MADFGITPDDTIFSPPNSAKLWMSYVIRIGWLHFDNKKGSMKL